MRLTSPFLRGALALAAGMLLVAVVWLSLIGAISYLGGIAVGGSGFDKGSSLLAAALVTFTFPLPLLAVPWIWRYIYARWTPRDGNPPALDGRGSRGASVEYRLRAEK